MPVDYPAARDLLDRKLQEVSHDILDENPAPEVPPDLSAHLDAVFQSRTQAYREVLVGCLLARIQDDSIDITLPYINLGDHAFNGRSLDEEVVNPFFHDNRIPSSRGPYLSVFRRSVTFSEETRAGVRDKAAFDALLRCLTWAADADEDDLQSLLSHLIYRFVELRQQSNVPLARIQRFSLPQYESLIAEILATPSGGRFPVFLIVAAFSAISERYGLGWEIDHQGINVADSPSGAGGDITVKCGDDLLMAAEVTERSVDRRRVVSTFNTKIGPAGIEDYLFFVSHAPDEETVAQCQQYFAQGHEVGFVEISNWLMMLLATIGRDGRETFNRKLLELLDEPDTPQTVRMSWNNIVNSALEIPD